MLPKPGQMWVTKPTGTLSQEYWFVTNVVGYKTVRGKESVKVYIQLVGDPQMQLSERLEWFIDEYELVSG